ncbi:hypothetical protein [Bradyrhizobium barranii]
MLQYNETVRTAIAAKTRRYVPIRSMTKRQRAQFALNIIEGRAPLANFTNEMIARACGVSIASVNRLKSGAQRLFADRLMKASAHELSDADIERLILAVGPDRFWCALDRVTAPELPLEAAE